MGKQKNQIVSIWEDTLTSLRRRKFTRSGCKLKGNNNSIVASAYSLWIMAIYDILTPVLGYDTPWRGPFQKFLQETDLTKIVMTCKAADKLLLTSINDDDLSYETFKQSLQVEYPAIEGLIAPMKELWPLWSLERDPQAFADIHMHLTFISRLNLEGLGDLRTDANADYLEIEDSIQQTDFTVEEAKVIERWFPAILADQIYEKFDPRFGPGAVSDRKSTCDGQVPPSIYEKYYAMSSDVLINQLTMRLKEEGRLPDFVGPRIALDRTCKVIFVPKSIDKLRTISSEPTTLTWYQQGFSSAINSYAFKNREHYLSRRIDLESQEKSRQLAYEGSIDGSYATIDLSSASDRISWALIKQWFYKSSLMRILMACRSRYASSRMWKTPLMLKKYAPMGSALTFPIQCIVFSAIVECAIAECGGRARDSLYRVYGDDIIVESIYAAAVIRRLEANGFVVNTKKTFYSIGPHNFRESCGGEYLDGFDVTPIRLSRRFSGLEIDEVHRDASRIVALCELCNTTFSRLPSVRRVVLFELNKQLPETLLPLFDSTGSKGIFSPNPTNHRARAPIWNKDLQIYEVTHGAMRNRKGTPDGQSPSIEALDAIRLFEWFRLTKNRSRLVLPEDRVLTQVLSPGLAIWTESTSRFESDML